MLRAALALVACVVAAACAPVDAGTVDAGTVDAGAAIACPTTLLVPGDVVLLPGACTVSLAVAVESLLELRTAPAVPLALDGIAGEEVGWVGPQAVSASSHAVQIGSVDSAIIELSVLDHGPPAPSVAFARSLAFTAAPLLDDPGFAGLGRVLGTVAAAAGATDGGGATLTAWLRRFSTTAHSERAGPLLFLEDLQADHGADPAAWDLDALPFRTTGVHVRLDLGDDATCGQLRVSIASVDPAHAPFHMLFLYAIAPRDDDRAPSGALHCRGAARQWARLSTLFGDDHDAALRALIDEALGPARFLMAETVELLVSPWEWRQWVLVANTDLATAAALPRVLDDVPLFQTIDVVAVNAPGPLREQLLAFVAANAAALDARTAEIPAALRARSARVNDGVPWVPLDLSGVDESVLAAYPDLRRNMEMVGCPACHATDAPFVQTNADRVLSPFYEDELAARELFVAALHRGGPRTAPFGPLQPHPLLPP